MPGPLTSNPVPTQALANQVSKGDYGYLQNPMMSGAGMPAARPMMPQGVPYKPAPMFQPKGIPNAQFKQTTKGPTGL